ncbi:hypothetical protein JST97_33080 [bacterium]|nr:hypothetical protein [bacterium]
MSDPVQLASQIRFSLQQLSERNGQHEFEHLCRHLARARICSNLLPGTGPVQAGGDQGRDFETYKTFLENKSLKGRAFIGLASEKSLVFACTLEKSLPTKIKKDVATIKSSGSPVDMIYVFATKDLNVAKRHELQEWCLANHSTPLEILDGAAISEMLVDHDVFWIAERFLHIPSELRPSPPEGAGEEDWYTLTLRRWQQRTAEPETFADFAELSSAGRMALGDPNGEAPPERQDLPFWLEKIQQLLVKNADFPLLRRKAAYELGVLQLRGTGTLKGQEPNLQLFFSEIPGLEDASELKDAQVLLAYVGAAVRQKIVEFGDLDIGKWHGELKRRLQERIQESKKRERWNEWCSLQETCGFEELRLHLWSGGAPKNFSLERWFRLCELSERAPLFPLDDFMRSLNRLTDMLWDNPRFDELTSRVERHLAVRFGQFRVADSCVERAKKLSESGNLIAAIRQLHKAKVEWFTAETIKNSLGALCWLSEQYRHLGLIFASKYCALSAAFIALHSEGTDVKKFMYEGTELAAFSDYLLGNWHSFLDMEQFTLVSHQQFNRHFEDEDGENGFVTKLIFHVGIIFVVTKLFYPDLLESARNRIDRLGRSLGLEQVFTETMQLAETCWETKGPADLWSSIEGVLHGAPWNDLEKTRATSWRSQGLTWKVSWPNKPDVTHAVEEFLSQLQIFLADVADLDLCLLRSTVEMRCFVNSDLKSKPYEIHYEPSNEERIVVVGLSSKDYGREFRPEPIALIASLLQHVSVLPRAKFMEILEARFKEGLANKLLVGGSYRTCLKQFEGNSSNPVEFGSRAPSFQSQAEEVLLWNSGPGPGYSAEGSAKDIGARYVGFARPIRRTLEMLGSSPEFLTVANRLHSEGWKDWHLLAAVFHVTMNERINSARVNYVTQAEFKRQSKAFLDQEETDNTGLLSPSSYSEEQLRFNLSAFANSVLETSGLELHQETPDTSAVLDFLGKRYNFWTDDVEHQDPFGRLAAIV